MQKKAEKKSAFPQIWICAIEWAFWKGERVRRGESIEVLAKDLKNTALKQQLANRFKRADSVTVVSEPITILETKKEVKKEV